MAPERHPVHQRSHDKAFSVQGLGGTPGGTRIPNLLIRRWTQTVHSGPLRSMASGTKRFAVHSRPWPSIAVRTSPQRMAPNGSQRREEGPV